MAGLEGLLVQFLIGWLLVRFVFRKCGDVAVAAAAAAAAAVAPKGKMWDGTRPKGGSFRRGKGRQSATSRVFLLSTG